MNKNHNKYLFLIPVYNDWSSLNLLINKINNELKKNKKFGYVIIVNDCSTQKVKLDLKKLKNIKLIKILNLAQNLGSQKAIFVGLNYLKRERHKGILSILDSDGEDNPKMLNKLIAEAEKDLNSVVVANRSKRNENIFLIFLNKIRLFITFFLTGKYLNFGNFSSFHTKNLKKILSNNNLCLAYSAGLLKNLRKLTYINIEKKKRYYGKSKANFKFLLNHSLKIICVFRREIFIRSIIIILPMLFVFKDHFIFSKILSIFLFINIFMNIFYIINNKNSNVLKLIRNIKVLD